MRYIFALMFLAGCETFGQPKPPTEVKVPVTTIIKPADVTRPALTSGTAENEYDAIVRALEVDLTLMKKYAYDLEQVIEVYKKGLEDGNNR